RLSKAKSWNTKSPATAARSAAEAGTVARSAARTAAMRGVRARIDVSDAQDSIGDSVAAAWTCEVRHERARVPVVRRQRPQLGGGGLSGMRPAAADGARFVVAARGPRHRFLHRRRRDGGQGRAGVA